MKKYLPSLDELIPGVITVIVAMVVWNFVAPTLLGFINKAKTKTA